MTPHFVLNPAFQIVAAYLIFIVGFFALFALALFFLALVCLLYRGANSLLSRSERQKWTLVSRPQITLTPLQYHE
jgi:hypothetical protein